MPWDTIAIREDSRESSSSRKDLVPHLAAPVAAVPFHDPFVVSDIEVQVLVYDLCGLAGTVQWRGNDMLDIE